jgi:phosphoglycerate dehydrogenase-like enzyme
MVTPADLDRVLPAADWLVLAPILSPETRGMIDARRIALLPRGARVINISRGAVIDETAMIEALRSGQLGGAYLDVFEKEPLPADSPLWSLPNVILTPHNSAVSRGKFYREADLFFENLRRWATGRPLINEVTPDHPALAGNQAQRRVTG